MRNVHDLAIQAGMCADATAELLRVHEPGSAATPEEIERATWAAAERSNALRLHLAAVPLAGAPEQVAADGKRLAQAIKDEAYPFESVLHGVYAEVRTIGYLQVFTRAAMPVLADVMWQEADPKARKGITASGHWTVIVGADRYPVSTLPDLLTVLRVIKIQARRG